MDTLSRYTQIVKDLIVEYSHFKPAVGEVQIEVILDDSLAHYELMLAGWTGSYRVHGSLLHIDIRNGKVAGVGQLAFGKLEATQSQIHREPAAGVVGSGFSKTSQILLKLCHNAGISSTTAAGPTTVRAWSSRALAAFRVDQELRTGRLISQGPRLRAHFSAASFGRRDRKIPRDRASPQRVSVVATERSSAARAALLRSRAIHESHIVPSTDRTRSASGPCDSSRPRAALCSVVATALFYLAAGSGFKAFWRSESRGRQSGSQEC